MLSDHCLSCPVCLPVLSVTLVYCGQTIGWIKTKLGVEVDLGPGHIVLDGDPALPKRHTATRPLFSPCVLWENGWTDQYAIWYGHRPQPRRHCVGWGPSSLHPYRGHSRQLFSPCLLFPNNWIDQDRCHWVLN